MSIVTYPLNGVTYDAEDAQTYLCTRDSGLFSTDEDFAISVTDDMEVTISSGQAWIKYADYRGISVCSDSSVALTVPTADSLDRIDRVVLRFDKSANASSLVIVSGTAASSPTAPDVEQDELIYELGLYTIAVAASATSIDSSCITDTRADTAVCGKMKDPVTSEGGDADNAATADALSTARSIQVNLASSSAVSFDGTVDITPGVTGTLPYGNGGTGATTLAAALYNLINGRTALTSSGVDSADYIPVQDVSAGTGKRILLSELASYVNNLSSTKVVVGTYAGAKSVTSEVVQTISLSSTPQFVWVGVLDDSPSYLGGDIPWYKWEDTDTDDVDTDGYTITEQETEMNSAYAYYGYPYWGGYDRDDSSDEVLEVLEIVSGGFQVRNVVGEYESSSGRTTRVARAYLNETGRTYFYLAVL